MYERVRTFSPGEEVAMEVGFTYKGDKEIESVEAVFAPERSGGEILLLGDARKEAPGGDQVSSYAARLGARVDPSVAPGEYRCARLSARDRLDDDWDFVDPGRLYLVIRVERAPQRLEVTASEFLRDG